MNCLKNIILQLTKSSFILIFFLSFLTTSIFGATKTWIGGNATWSTYGNWSPSGAPGAGDDVIINTSSSITVTGNTIINRLTITGNANVVLITSGGSRTLTIDNTGSSIDAGSSLTLQGLSTNTSRFMTLAFTGTSRTMQIAGSLILKAVGGGGLYNATNSVTTVTGSIINDGSGGGTAGSITSTSANLSFSAGSEYVHARNGGVIPTAYWDAASTCNVTGVTGTVPLITSFNQSFGNFIWNCTGQAGNYSLGTNLKTINGNFTVSSTNTSQLILTAGTATTLTVGKDFLMTAGTLNFNSGAGASVMNVAGNFSHTGGTITETSTGTGSVIFNGSSAQTYTSGGSCANTINFTVSTGATLLMANETTVVGNGSIGTFTLEANGTLGVTSVDGITTTGATGNIRVSGTRTYTAAANYIYNGINPQAAGNGLTQNSPVNNLTINNSSGVSLSAATTISGNLTLTNGTLSTTTVNSAYLLTLNNTSASAISGGSAASFIDGAVLWNLPVLATGTVYQFPVGKGSTYLPFTLVNPTTSGTSSAKVEAFSSNSGGSADGTTLSSISTTEYWSFVAGTNFTNSSVTLAKATAVAPMDAIGGSTAANGSYTLLSGTKNPYSISNSDLIGTKRFFTLAKGKPFINTPSPTTLSGFSYYYGLGPSTEQSFTISSRYLIDNLTVQAPSNYEISAYPGAYFVPNSSISFLVSEGVTNTTVYVRLKAGLNVGNYNTEIITASSTNAVNKTVTCNGNVLTAPNITISTSTLSNFGYVFGNGPSAEQSTLTVSGTNLIGNITVSAPTNYEISKTSGIGYASSLTFTPTSGSVSVQTVYVRLKTGLNIGSYNESIAFTSSSAVTRYVNCEGAVSTSTIIVSTTTLAGFIYNSGSGLPLGYQTLTVSGQNLSGNITLTAPANFEISTSAGGTYGSSLTLIRSGNIVSNTTIYVRMISGLGVGTYGPSNMTITSTGAVTQNVACSGQVVGSSTQATICSTGTLNGFVYTYANGPSIVQSFTVSGTNLGSNVTLTPPANFEISLSSGSGFVSSPSTLSIPKDANNKVSGVLVYVRLKAGLGIATYGPGNIVLTSTGAATINVECNGVVIAAPSITATSTNNGNVCPGSSITLSYTGANISNPYWTGPNSYYSTSPTSQLTTNATSTLNGTYTVTGSALSNVNLLTNGNFTSGNTGFGSSYSYSTNLAAGGQGAGEGQYWVGANPYTVHTGFSQCADKTTGSLTTGRQMVINGAITSGVIIWSQSVSVTPGADYQFSYWVQSVVATSPSKLQLYINGLPAGPIYTATLGPCDWKQFIYNWSASTGENIAQLALVNQNTLAGGNDFALDEIIFQQIFSVTSATTVTVYPTLAPAVSVSASANPVLTGTPVTFTAVPSNAGVNPSYQWQKNGTNIPGATNSTYTTTPNDGETYTCVITSNYICPSPTTASSGVTMVVNPGTNYWMGGISTDWGTAGNWTAGFVPLGGQNVEYADGTNYVGPLGTVAQRDLHLDVNRAVGQFINRTPRALVIKPATTLTVNSTITTLNNTNQIYILADENLANGSLIYHNTQNAPVYGTVEMWSKSSWDKSRPVNQRYNWQYFGIPIDTVKASPTVDGAYIRYRNEAGNDTTTHWQSLTNSSNIIPFHGYELCYETPRKIVFQGKLVNRNFNSGQLTKTSTGGVLYGGQYIFANPYTAAIDILQFNFGSDVEQTIYLYNTGTFSNWSSGTAGKIGSTPGQYTSSPKNMAGVALIPRQIPSMSSMLIRVLNSSPNAYIDINYNSAAMGNTELHRAPSSKDLPSKYPSIRIDAESKSANDRMWLFVDDHFTPYFDNGFDGIKMTGSALNQQIYAVEKDGNYQIDAVKDIENSNIAFQAGQDTDYKLTFTNENIAGKYEKLYLYDIQENKVIEITESGTTYEFTAQSTPNPVLRFRIITKKETNQTSENSNIVFFNINNNLYFYNQGTETCKIYLYDISGRNISQKALTANSSYSIGVEMQRNYILKMSDSTSTTTKKIMIQ